MLRWLFCGGGSLALVLSSDLEGPALERGGKAILAQKFRPAMEKRRFFLSEASGR